eukprot:TRINITY_DN34519_c0_g1_i1.p3 TRINITY_DN34519_c0_g1~~TRINITY_DN34519_c0_g1_i1.p3  ORF type:complete len:136 (+),score=8.64 TRINITY_DN34519_c0_g1_i1:49-408(+)
MIVAITFLNILILPQHANPTMLINAQPAILQNQNNTIPKLFPYNLTILTINLKHTSTVIATYNFQILGSLLKLNNDYIYFPQLPSAFITQNAPYVSHGNETPQDTVFNTIRTKNKKEVS